MSRSISAIFLLFAISIFDTVFAQSQSVQSSLDGTSWQWTSWTSAEQLTNSDSRRFWIKFEEERVTVRAGCNEATGRFELGGERSIALRLYVETSAACDRPSSQFLDELRNAKRYILKGDELFLASDSGWMRFVPLTK